MRTKLILTALLLAPSAAWAQDLPYHRPQPRTDFTAYTRPRGRAALGPLKVELGITDQIMVGSYVPPWFAFTLVGAPAPNLYLKVRDWWSGPLTLALRGGFLHLDGRQLDKLTDADASGGVTALLGEFDASLQPDAPLCLSFGVEFSHLAAAGQGSSADTSIEGASTGQAVQARLFGQWQLTRVVGLTLLLRYVAYQGPKSADISAERDGTTIDADLSSEPGERRERFAAVPGVSFDWEHWEFYVGVGYGALALPALGIPTTKAWPIVDLAVAFHFDLYD